MAASKPQSPAADPDLHLSQPLDKLLAFIATELKRPSLGGAVFATGQTAWERIRRIQSLMDTARNAAARAADPELQKKILTAFAGVDRMVGRPMLLWESVAKALDDLTESRTLWLASAEEGARAKELLTEVGTVFGGTINALADEAAVKLLHSPVEPDVPWYLIPDYAMPHATAVGMLELGDVTRKQKSRHMAKIRSQYSNEFRWHKNGNVFLYHPIEWLVMVKKILRIRKDDGEQRAEADGVPADLEMRKAEVRANRRHG